MDAHEGLIKKIRSRISRMNIRYKLKGAYITGFALAQIFAAASQVQARTPEGKIIKITQDSKLCEQLNIIIKLCNAYKDIISDQSLTQQQRDKEIQKLEDWIILNLNTVLDEIRNLICVHNYAEACLRADYLLTLAVKLENDDIKDEANDLIALIAEKQKEHYSTEFSNIKFGTIPRSVMDRMRPTAEGKPEVQVIDSVSYLVCTGYSKDSQLAIDKAKLSLRDMFSKYSPQSGFTLHMGKTQGSYAITVACRIK